ncbi:MAG: hypothetical protein R8K20_05100 [Gallionellaceae bacterium]
MEVFFYPLSLAPSIRLAPKAVFDSLGISRIDAGAAQHMHRLASRRQPNAHRELDDAEPESVISTAADEPIL